MAPNPSSTDVQLVLENIMLVRLLQLSATVMVLYDHICTFDDEVKYIWKKARSSSKVLFISLRYIGDAYVIFEAVVFTKRIVTEYFCYTVYRIIPVGSTVLTLLCQMILFYRLCALYSNCKWFRPIFGGLYLLEAGGLIAIVVYVQMRYTVSLMELPGAYLCRATNVTKVSILLWPITLVYETIMFCLAVGKFLSDLKHIRTIGAMRNMSLTRIILVDSLIYFCIGFIIYLGIAIAWIAEPGLHRQISFCFVPTFTIIIGCRLILHLSKVHAEDLNHRRDIWSSHIRVDPSRGHS